MDHASGRPVRRHCVVKRVSCTTVKLGLFRIGRIELATKRQRIGAESESERSRLPRVMDDTIPFLASPRDDAELIRRAGRGRRAALVRSSELDRPYPCAISDVARAFGLACGQDTRYDWSPRNPRCNFSDVWNAAACRVRR